MLACSDVIDVIVITRLHGDGVKMKYENACRKVIYRPCISTGV